MPASLPEALRITPEQLAEVWRPADSAESISLLARIADLGDAEEEPRCLQVTPRGLPVALPVALTPPYRLAGSRSGSIFSMRPSCLQRSSAFLQPRSPHITPQTLSRDAKQRTAPSLKALASFDLIQSLASHAVNALVANEGVVADGLNTRSSAPWYLNAPCAAIGELPASCLSFFSSAVLESTKAMAPSERFSLASTHASR